MGSIIRHNEEISQIYKFYLMISKNPRVPGTRGTRSKDARGINHGGERTTANDTVP